MSRAQDFVVFWESYPRKVGKLAAEKAYDKARKRGVTQERILQGITNYVRHKPSYADFCHPATWLNHGRWDDEYERRNGDDRRAQERREPPITAEERRRAMDKLRAWGYCPHDERCESTAMCVGRIVKQWREDERAALES